MLAYLIAKVQYVFLLVMAIPTMIWLITYLIPQIYMAYIRSVPIFKDRYKGVTWSLVTGGGSGIGKAVCMALAEQGLNIVIVSLDDIHLQQTVSELQQKYPSQQFRPIGISFTYGIDYMKIIEEKIQDIQNDIRVIFCNAGYMITGFMDQTDMVAILNNIECNAISHIRISHYFIKKMIQNHNTGCIVFTSSVAGFIPTPFAVMYASTKAMISQYAASLHIENKPHGIDICAIHPSPVASHFYANLQHKVDMIEAAAKHAVSPHDIVPEIFRSIGACAYRDLGGLAWATRIGTFFLPYNFFTELFTMAAPYLDDWKNHDKNRFTKSATDTATTTTTATTKKHD